MNDGGCTHESETGIDGTGAATDTWEEADRLHESLRTAAALAGRPDLPLPVPSDRLAVAYAKMRAVVDALAVEVERRPEMVEVVTGGTDHEPTGTTCGRASGRSRRRR